LDITLPFHFIHHDDDVGEALSQHILSHYPTELDQITVWCNARSHINSLQKTLIKQAQQHGIHAMALPEIITLNDWAWQQRQSSAAIISETEKNLILVEALRENRNFFKTHNIWSMANELVKLFNECTLAQVPLNNSLEAFEAALNSGYGVNTEHAKQAQSLHHISRESEILYNLWLAYREQIQARTSCDPIEHYVTTLSQLPATQKSAYYVVNHHRFHACEIKFLQYIHQHKVLQIFYPEIVTSSLTCKHHPHAKLLGHTNTDHSHKYSPLDIIFDESTDLPQRIHTLSQEFPNGSMFDKLSLYTCHDNETHVRAVCMQVKSWCLEGRQGIGIVANDRLLIRRIRAVLEEEGIFPKDLGGWSFSTTSAATCIEILLDAIERNFNKGSLLTLLGSPFLSRDAAYRDQYYIFKHFLSDRNNLSSDTLGTFRQLAKDCFDSQELPNELIQCLDNLAIASQALQTMRAKGEQSLHKFNMSLFTLLEELGIENKLSNDAAGVQLLDTLIQSNNFIQASGLRINWSEWRQWLKNIFEKNYFISDMIDEQVTVCGFEHIDDIQLNHIILAGVEERRLQSVNTQRTFFNEKVRYELNLSTTSENNAINFVRFRQLVESCQSLMMSAEIEQNGEQQTLSPWVTMIEYFNHHSYQKTIINSDLDYQIAEQLIYQQHSYSDPSVPPHVKDSAHLLSHNISSTKYQSLLDCPYQFFAKYILELRTQSISDDLQASDYGQLVHSCLKEFHFDNNAARFSDQTHKQLCELLETISIQQFNRTNFTSTSIQGWLQKWLATIPYYVSWAEEKHQDWQAIQGEIWCEKSISNEYLLQGQIDRIDQDGRQLGVIDYKTGSTIASGKSVENGEAVQLPFYALLKSQISQVEYLPLGDRDKVKSKVIIKGENLEQLKQQHSDRLSLLYHEIKDQSLLPANGDKDSCKYCDYEGMCRKSHWQE
jgi:ATP-dependent helicase/nuclease subunit B